MTFPDNQPPVNVVFGCVNGETGELYRQMADGLVGMGNSANAFHSQVSSRTGARAEQSGRGRAGRAIGAWHGMLPRDGAGHKGMSLGPSSLQASSRNHPQ